ncbi:MAG: TIGR02186 family protein [Alphaproteobacteria bacterium]
MKKIFFILLLFCLNPISGRTADLSEHIINMDINFHQKLLLVTGEVENRNEEVVITLIGPRITANLWQKRKLFGIWVNGQKKVFKDIPAFYFWATTDLSLPDRLTDWQKYILLIGDKALGHNFYNQIIDFKDIRKYYSDGLLETLSNKKVYFPEANRFFKNKKKFYLPIVLYPETPVGNYHITIYYFLNSQIVRTEQLPLLIEKKGLSSFISRFAEKNSLLYGVIAIIISIGFGILSSFIYDKYFSYRSKQNKDNEKS